MNTYKFGRQPGLANAFTGVLLVMGLLCWINVSMAQTAKPAADDEGFVPIFDGNSLDGWTVAGPAKDAFGVEEGALVCKNPSGDDWIRTTTQYEDFILRLEYRISEGGNSGIFIRATRYGNPAYTGMEVQILDDAGKEPDVHSSGAIYGSVAPSQNASKPAGEWNSVEISCIKRQIKTVLNGIVLYDINLDDYETPLQRQTPLKFRVRKGYIGLQDHGNTVWFRNIRVKEVGEE
ncbi:MAG: DUF1080 domain-containing protein [bacterium]